MVYVKYFDHSLFRNMAPSNVKPAIRETVGWLIYQDDEALWIIWDRSVDSNRFEKPDPSSGLVILRKCILEVREIC